MSFHKDVQRFVRLSCGVCHFRFDAPGTIQDATAEADHVGWRHRSGWGWLCPRHADGSVSPHRARAGFVEQLDYDALDSLRLDLENERAENAALRAAIKAAKLALDGAP